MPHCGAPWNFTRLFAKITKCDRLPLKFCMRFLLPALPFPSCLAVCVAFLPGFPRPQPSGHFLPCLLVRPSASLTCYACKSLWQIHRPWPPPPTAAQRSPTAGSPRQMGVTCKIFLHKNVCPATRIGVLAASWQLHLTLALMCAGEKC